MDFSHTKKIIDGLCNQLGLPYLDVACYHGHARVFRYYAGKRTKGNEHLCMYSCSKPITCVAALRLCEKGLISLDDSVEKYLSAAGDLTVCNGGEITRCKEKLKIKHLFTMTAGLDYNALKQPVVELLKNNKKAGTVEVCNAFLRSPLLFEPGSEYRYSLCHDVLAAIVEKASGEQFSEFVEREIFLPLGMVNSSFSAVPKWKTAKMYGFSNGKIKKAKGYAPTTKLYESGGAGLISCVDDYGVFADALACGGMAKNGYRLLGKETVELMRTVQDEARGFSCAQGDDYGYGLGVRVRTADTDFGLPVGEFGWDGMAGSYVMIDPKNHVSVFIGMHLKSWTEIFKGKHLEIVESIYRDAGYDKIHRKSADEEEHERKKRKQQGEIDAFKKRYFGLYSDIKISHREDW